MTFESRIPCAARARAFYLQNFLSTLKSPVLSYVLSNSFNVQRQQQQTKKSRTARADDDPGIGRSERCIYRLTCETARWSCFFPGRPCFPAPIPYLRASLSAPIFSSHHLYSYVSFSHLMEHHVRSADLIYVLNIYRSQIALALKNRTKL